MPARADVAATLRQLGAPATCSVISSTPVLDARELLRQAIDAIDASMGGALVSCVAGRLAYHRSESGEAPIVLRRDR